MDSVLTLTAIGLPPYAARGLTQTLQPIENGELRRTVNGTLVDLTRDSIRKYRSTITGEDIEPPAFENLWRGMDITVGCMVELAEAGTGTSLARTPVAGSQRWVNAAGKSLANASGAAFTFYRPLLNMLVTDWSLERDEWGGRVSWSLALEEK